MGEGLLRICRQRLSREAKAAFFLTFFSALFIHLYKFTNVLPNHDSLYNYYTDQNVLGSGRWALSLSCSISSYYDLPWVIGILSCIFIALTVVVITALFELKNPVLIGLIGALLAASPATTETFFFLYTADGYMIGMLLAALSVYLTRVDEQRRLRWLLSGVCLCISCGIYQAHVSFALLLAVCYFIDALLQNRFSKAACLRWVLRQAALYACSLASYYAIWKLLLHLSGTAINSYQGISEVGTLSFSLLKNGLISSVRTALMYFLQWNVIEHGFSFYSVLSLIFLAALAFVLVYACVKSDLLRRKWAMVLLVLCLLAIVPFAGLWHFVSASVNYRAIMLQSLTLLFALCGMLYERWMCPTVKNAAALLLAVIVFNNALMANISYSYMQRCYERTYADGLEMMLSIHALADEYEFDKLAVVGSRSYELQYEPFDPMTGEMRPSAQLHLLSGGLETNLLFDAERTAKFLNFTFGLALDTPLNAAQRNELLHSENVQAMPCWPDHGSMAVLGDMLVLKLSDREEVA